MEYTGAFLQLYRTEGWYLERTVHYLARVGIDYIKQVILNDHERRRALYEELLFALDGVADPWHQPQEAQVDVRQFSMIQA